MPRIEVGEEGYLSGLVFMSHWTTVVIQMAPRSRAPIRRTGSTVNSSDSIVPEWREALSGSSTNLAHESANLRAARLSAF